MCQSHFTLVLSNQSTNAGMVVEAKCGCWKCPDCGIDLRTEWLARATEIFEAAAMWEVSVCNRHQFEALTRRLSKAGKVYYRIRFGDESHVFHQPLVKTRQYTPDESKWLGSSATVTLFRETLFRPGVSRVSCSRALTPRKPEQVKTAWKREAVKKQTVQQVNAFLGRLLIGQTISHAKAFDGRLLDVILLRDFPVFQPSKPTSPSISIKALPVVLKNRKTPTTRMDCGPVEYEFDVNVADEASVLMVT